MLWAVSATNLTARGRNSAGYDDGRRITMILPTSPVSGHAEATQLDLGLSMHLRAVRTAQTAIGVAPRAAMIASP
jgi:hypothetical protein